MRRSGTRRRDQSTDVFCTLRNVFKSAVLSAIDSLLLPCHVKDEACFASTTHCKSRLRASRVLELVRHCLPFAPQFVDDPKGEADKLR
jgi:hypothetical protein